MQRNQMTMVVGTAVLILAIIAFANTGNLNFTGSGLYPISVSGKYGFINKSGKVMVTPQFDDAGLFQDGFAPVAMGKLWGYADRKESWRFRLNSNWRIHSQTAWRWWEWVTG